MKILIICSKRFYSKIPNIKLELEKYGHEIFLPNCYDKPNTEEEIRKLGYEEHSKFKAKMFKQSEDTISKMDAVLVLNYDKITENEILENYIGGATFLEMYDAFRMNKQIFMINPIPSGILYDEIEGFNPIIVDKNKSLSLFLDKK